MADKTHLSALAEKLRNFPARPGTKIMEVCGTHTVAIRRFGVQRLLPDGVKLVSGPGCPVCVTPDSTIDEAVALARQGVVITSFGDMLRVPGSRSSLEKERAAGADVRAVYSPLDALQIAVDSGRETVFLAVGFETTAPTIAAAAMKAVEKKIANFSLLTSLRLVPPALKALIAVDTGLSGFLLPGHVSAIIGRQAYDFLPGHRLPGVISGFSAEDIISSLLLLFEMFNKDIYKVVNNYPAAVRDNGNEKSRRLLAEMFEPADAEWRGLGSIPGSGLKLKPAYSRPGRPPPFHYPCRKHLPAHGLPLRRRAARPDRSPRLPAVQQGLPPRPAAGAVHGVERRQLQRLGDLWIRSCWPTAAAAARAPS